MHDIQILEPMSRSNSYDFTKQDLEEMFSALEECLNTTKQEFYKKFEEKEARSVRKTFTFGALKNETSEVNNFETVENTVEQIQEKNDVLPIE